MRTRRTKEHWDVTYCSPTKQITEDMVTLNRPSPLDIAQHGGHQRRTRCCEYGTHAIQICRTRFKSLLGRDRAALAKQLRQHTRRAGSYDRGSPAEYGAGLKLAIERGWLKMKARAGRLPSLVRYSRTPAQHPGIQINDERVAAR